MNNACPLLGPCPIYTGILQGKTMTSKAYRQFYCESDFKSCKRHMVKEATGKCPSDLLPNSIMSVDEIIKEHNLMRINQL